MSQSQIENVEVKVKKNLTLTNRKARSKKYYDSHLGKKKPCPVCECDISIYNTWNHSNTLKHKLNLVKKDPILTDEEKKIKLGQLIIETNQNLITN